MESTTTSNALHDRQVPKEIVCLYAMRDEPMYRELQTHFSLWQEKGSIRWLELSAGVDVEETQRTFLQQADLILLLISADFFIPRVCRKALNWALAEHEKRDVPVIPVLARACMWKESDCGELQALPENEQPIAEWEYPERAYEAIGAGVARTLGLSLLPGRPRLFLARDLPRGYVARPKAFQEIKNLLLVQRGNQSTAIPIALRGAGGFGKTMLGLALCHDAEVQAACPDGILWVELGEQPPRALDLLNGLLASLEVPHHEAITLEEAQERWRTALHNRVCLLVIDDVWQAAALEPLLEGGLQCVRLVTTRNDQVLPERGIRVQVDAMESAEAIEVLRRGLPDEIQHPMHSPALEMLAKRLGYWPLLLSLARGMLVTQVSYGQSIPEALTIVEKAYQTRGVTAFHLGHASERQRTADACLEVSLQHVEEFTSAHYQAAERYQELAIFPEDTDIPLATLQIFWKAAGGLEPWETQDLCIHLHRLSLLLTCDLSNGTIRLHDVLRSYLVQRAGSRLPTLHASLLDAYRQVLGLNRWADLPLTDHYLWQYLVHHLCHASRTEDLQSTLTDLGYLTHKALYMGIAALEADCLLASTSGPGQQTAAVASIFLSLYRSIVRLSHLLRQTRTAAEIGGLLLSHLGREPAFAAQRLSLERELPRPFIVAQHPLPRRPSSALLRTLDGHSGPVYSCAASPDGDFIVSASTDKTLKVWDAATGAERLTLSGHTDAVWDCIVSADSSFIVSASMDKTLKVWDVATGTERLTLTGHTDQVHSCAVSSNGRCIVSASMDKTLKVWDAATGAERFTLPGHTSWVSSCAVSPDADFIVSASEDQTLKVWDSGTGAERFTLTGHIGHVRDCAVSPDGRFIVSASNDETLKVWNAATGEDRFTLKGHASGVYCCAVSPDSRFIVSASMDETLKVWDVATGAEHLTLTGHADSVLSCAVSPDGRRIISASRDRTLKVWDAATRSERLTFTGHTAPVTCCVVSPDGKWIVSASEDETLKVWDATTGTERLTLRGHTHEVTCCAVSPDGRFIVSASNDETLKVWNATTGAERLSFKGHTSWVYGCAVSPDSRFIVSISGDPFGSDCILKVWDAATGEERLTLKGHTSVVTGCAVSPDGRFIVSASWDQTLKVWDAATGEERHTLKGHTSFVTSCAVSPDSGFIVSASMDDTLKVWDAATGAERHTLKGHASTVNDCAVSPDGRFIISVSNDKTLKLWDAHTGQCMLTFPVDGEVLGCAFHPDGQHLVACGAQGMYFLWLVV